MLERFTPRLHGAVPDTAPDCREHDLDEFTGLLGQVCGRFGVVADATRKGTVSGAVAPLTIARFSAAVVSLNARKVLRDRRMIRADPGEHLFVIFQQAGSSTIVQDDRACALATGDFFIADSAVPSEFVYAGQASSQISLHLPRDEAVARMGQGCVGGQAICRSDALFPALTGVFLRLRDQPPGSAALGEALINILSAYFHARAQGHDSPSTRLYTCAIDRLEVRAGDPDFGIDTLAADLGVSRRTLQRVFTDNGDGFTRRLQALRLDRARSRLLGGQADILRVAYDCGFSDLSHFYRLFRDRFGMAPGQIRPKPEGGRRVA